ncbi:MAG: Gfo/Idh/MocA family oxidoreductase [Candidatus Dormibacteraceae bacterium]
MTRVALIGLGTMGRNHLRVLSELSDAELVAVCDQDAAAVEVATKNLGISGYVSWQEMMGREKLEAVIVAVPTRFHLEVGDGALDHGLHVLIEKPIATDLEEGRALVEKAAQAKRILAVGHIERFNPAVRELQRRLAAGEIGRMFQVQARRLGPFPARIRDVGVVIDLATHDLDAMSHIAGSAVHRVYAETEQRIHTDHEDILNALLKFESGMLGVLQVNWLTPTKIRELSVLGERGMLVCNYLTQELTYFRNADVKPGNFEVAQPHGVSEGDVVRHKVTQAEPLKLELESFLQAVRGEHPVEVDGQAGLRALHLALALIESATESRALNQAELDRLWTAPPARKD